jgi:hypothetical protein
VNVSLPDVHGLTDVLALLGTGIITGAESVLRNGYGQAVVLTLLVIITATMIGDRTAAWRTFTDYEDDAPFLTDEQRAEHMLTHTTTKV